MTHEDIIRMAREAGFEINKGQYHGMDADSYLYIWCDGGYQDEELKRFAALVAAAEREACAKVCDERARKTPMGSDESCEAEDCAAAIRARGEE